LRSCRPLPPDLESRLLKLLEESSRLRGLRRPGTVDVFERVAYIWPHQIRIREMAGRRPFAAFNPAAMSLGGGRIAVFPRLITGYFWYTSVVGYFEAREPYGAGSEGVEVRVVLHPSDRMDLAGCEDPRVEKSGDRLYLLYTALEPLPERVHAVNAISRQGIAVLDAATLKVVEKNVLCIRHGDGLYEPAEWKDSALLGASRRETWLLTRLMIRGVQASWRGLLSMEDYTVSLETLEPVLVPEHWEYKTGWSTNAAKISSNEYLVGWHGVGRDLVYRSGFAVFSQEGELLAVSREYLLAPSRPEEYIGERPGVIFGCGLIVESNRVTWVGGVADTGIGFYQADLDDIMEHMVWLKP